MTGGMVAAAMVAVAVTFMGGVVWLVAGATGAALSLLGWSLAASGAAAVLAAFAGGMALGGRFGRRLAVLGDAAKGYGFGRGQVSVFALAGDDEVARLGRALSEMAERLHASYREVERRGRSQLSNAERIAQLGTAERDLVTNVAMWSDEFHAILGMKPGEGEPSPDLFIDFVHPGDRDVVAEVLRAAVQDGQSGETDFRIVRPDGQIRILHGCAEVVVSQDGISRQLNATIQDITERKRLEDELDGLIRELWRSNEELEQFAYVASHDLRQPLRVVGSYVSLMEEDLRGQLTGEVAEYMDFVRDGVRRMDRLITDLLTYSRVGRISADKPVSMAVALGGAMADLQFEIEDAGGSVRVESALPAVMGDDSELERLFQNLLGNAIKYRRPGIVPEVVVRCADLGDDWGISISDNGIGIPPAHAERVFGIFQRLHGRDEFEGTGVGLAIVKKIVERHGGIVRVEPVEAEGTRIAFTWPKMRAVVEEL